MASYEDPFGWRLSMEGTWEDQLSAPALSMAGDFHAMSAEELSTKHEPEPPAPGTEKPRYDKISILGQGGMGRVWLGWDTKLERHVAIKEPLEGAGSITHQRLMREVFLTAQLEHSGVVAVHDVYKADERTHFVMALVRGETLAKKLSCFDPDDDTERARLIARILEVCDVISHAHKHCIIHRDLSPRNILITGEDGNSARVIDWGLAISLDEAANPHGSAGTPGYASPEQRIGGVLGTRSDVWSLGALLHSVLHGAPPDEPSRRKTALNPELEAIATRALQEDPRDRYPDARAMGEDLRRWLEGRLVQAYDATPWRLLKRFARIHRVPLFFAATALLASSAALAWGVANTKREAERARKAEAHATERAEQAHHAAAILHGESAKRHLEEGDHWAAHQDIAASLRHRQEPEHIGLAMRAAFAALPEKMSETRLPHCEKGWRLGNRKDRVLCQSHRFEISMFDGEAFIWSLESDPLYLRVGSSTVEFLNSDRERYIYSADTGELITHDPRMGDYSSTRHGGGVLSVHRNGWLDADHHIPCAEDFGDTWLAPDLSHSYIQCNDGDIYRCEPGKATRVKESRIGSIQHFLRDARGHMWAAGIDGNIERLESRRELLPFGENLKGMENIPGSDLILVVGHSGAARILDPVGHRWVTSFPPGAKDLRPTLDGQIMRLTRDNNLEIWKVPTPTISEHRGQRGISKNDISLDDTLVATIDGGGYVHMFSPGEGRLYEPRRLSMMVGKSIGNTYDGKDLFVVTTMDMNTQPVISHDENSVIEVGARDHRNILARRIFALADHSIVHLQYDAGFLLKENEHTTFYLQELDFFEGATNIDGEKLLLLERTGAWIYSTTIEDKAERMRKVTAIDDTGLTDGDFSNDGKIALLHKLHVAIHDEESGALLHEFPIPSRGVSLAWRPGSEHIVTGHLDGSLYVWDTRGNLLAESLHHNARISEVTITRSGKWMATSGWDSSTHMLSFEPLDEILAKKTQ